MLGQKPLRIVEKRIGDFSGHVYNFQTPHGWYAANGLLLHNCRCSAIPVLPEWEELSQAAEE